MSKVAVTAAPPALGEDGADRLAAGALSYLNTRSALMVGAVALAGVATICVLLAGAARGMALLVLGAFAVFAWVWEGPFLNRRVVRHTSYTVAPAFVHIVRGRWFRRSTTIAAHRILNVQCVEGPLQRKFGLAEVRFVCAGAVVSLGPLLPERAAAIRDDVLVGEGWRSLV